MYICIPYSYSYIKDKSIKNRSEANDQELIQLPHTSHPRHQRERNTNIKKTTPPS